MPDQGGNPSIPVLMLLNGEGATVAGGMTANIILLTATPDGPAA